MCLDNTTAGIAAFGGADDDLDCQYSGRKANMHDKVPLNKII